MTDAERAIVLNPQTRAARAQIDPIVTMATPRVRQLATVTPPYVSAALDALMESLTLWKTQEQLALSEQPHPAAKP